MHETRRPYDDLRMSAEMNSLFETDNRDTSEDRQSRDYSEYQQYHEIDNLGDYQRDGRGETQLIKESNEGGVRWKGWNYLDTSQGMESSFVHELIKEFSASSSNTSSSAVVC